jgi:hypothetical protein
MWFELGRKSTLLVLPLVTAFTLAACDDDTTNPPLDTEWEATLVGVGTHGEVDGTAVVESNSTRFVAEISITGATAQADFGWTLARGTCASPGTALGAANRYPELDVASNGSAAAEANVPVGLDEDEDYIIRVFDVTGTTTVTVACGALDVQ